MFPFLPYLRLHQGGISSLQKQVMTSSTQGSGEEEPSPEPRPSPSPHPQNLQVRLEIAKTCVAEAFLSRWPNLGQQCIYPSFAVCLTNYFTSIQTFSQFYIGGEERGPHPSSNRDSRIYCLCSGSQVNLKFGHFTSHL